MSGHITGGAPGNSGDWDELARVADALISRDRAGEVADLLRAEQRVVTLAQRLTASRDPVSIQTVNGLVTGVVRACVNGFLVLAVESVGSAHAFVALNAVTSVRGLPHRHRAVDSLEDTGAPLVQINVTSWLARHLHCAITLHSCVGTSNGVLTAVFADHIEVHQERGTSAIPLSAIQVLFADGC